MSDILIKGMEMPINCYCCPCSNLEYFDCNLMPGTRISTDRRSGKRLDNCPLVPVPPHGRLIDADALDDVLMQLAENEYTPKVFASWLTYEENAPTIIPAEEGET